MSGELLTAPHTVRGSYATTDQGVDITPETDLYCLSHPPFITVVKEPAGVLDGLTPPDGLVADWNRNIPDSSIPRTWNKVKYEERYKEFLSRDEKARNDIFKVKMLSQIKTICLVCSCHQWNYCIRRLVYEYITEGNDMDDDEKALFA